MLSTSRADGRGSDGSAAAEFAIVLPAVLLVLATLLGGIELGVLQARAQDAAADAARGLARGDADASVRSWVESRLPGAAVSHSEVDGLLCVEVSVGSRGVPGLLGIRVGGRGCAVDDRA